MCSDKMMEDQNNNEPVEIRNSVSEIACIKNRVTNRTREVTVPLGAAETSPPVLYLVLSNEACEETVGLTLSTMFSFM